MILTPLNPRIRDWSGLRVWLVGASSGIGAALAAELLARGARLLFHALAVGVQKRDDTHIDALLVETRSGRYALRAQQFIDAGARCLEAGLDSSRHRPALRDRLPPLLLQFALGTADLRLVGRGRLC
mgnify:CR=1 FL=1